MSRLTDDMAKASQLINAVAHCPGMDLASRRQALEQLQAQLDARLRGVREQQADELKGVDRG